MASVTSALKRLKALAKVIPDETRIRGLLRVIENRQTGSDYAVAIIGASLVERALEVAILSRFVVMTKDERNRLFSYEAKGPLADFAARIRMAAALGLFGPSTLHNLETIRTIRNNFAHSATLRNFAHQDIISACDGFQSLPTTDDNPPGRIPPKTNYVTACVTIARQLRHRLENANEEDATIRFPKGDNLLP
jgi:hypothetical protein